MSKIEKILVPIDFSEGSKAAAEYALKLAGQFQASVTFLHIWEYPYYVGNEVMLQVPGQTAQTIIEFAKANAEREMKDFQVNMEKEGVQVHEVIRGGFIDKEIIDCADKEKFDLIVMGTHGRRGLSRMFLGSVAEKIIRHAHCPVLTINPKSDKSEA